MQQESEYSISQAKQLNLRSARQSLSSNATVSGSETDAGVQDSAIFILHDYQYCTAWDGNRGSGSGLPAPDELHFALFGKYISTGSGCNQATSAGICLCW